MNRRRVLALVGIGAGVSGGYFVWDWYRSPSLPEGMDVDTVHTKGSVLADDNEFFNTGDKERHLVVGDSETAADTFDPGEESVASFVDDTDFGESYLLVVQKKERSGISLELRAIERADGGIHVEVKVDVPPRGVEDDEALHTILIRITDEEAGMPGTVTVDIEE